MNLLSVYPLPLFTYTHDPSATILSDSGVQYAYEEEKLLRFQYAISDFPERSAVLGLKTLDLKPEDIDLLVVTSMDQCDKRPDYAVKVEYIKDLLSLRQSVEVECVPHHLAHSGLAVFTSPFKECMFLTMDGGGDGLMGHWGVYRNRQLNIVDQFEFSPAILYGYLTCLAGYSLFEEGKVMGLSSYGSINERLYRWLKKNFWIERHGAAMRTSDEVKLQWKSTLDPQLINADTFRRHKYFQLEAHFENSETRWLADLSPLEIACTGQRVFEEMISEAVQNLVTKTGIRKVALGGGAFQNIVLNGKLRATPGIDTYVSMAPHDSGLSLGAGLIKLYERSSRDIMHPASAYLGPAFTEQEIEQLLRYFSLTFERSTKMQEVIVNAIISGKVVGWFQGRAEFGARALGARSVLADPRNVNAKSRLNQALKKRDWFMPYAPSVLEEYGDEYFENFAPSPYMNVGFSIRSDKAHLIPAAIHVDGSCRAHTVNSRDNAKYHELITHFYSQTGIPMILNTSFNRHGIPIVATPRQAIQHLVEGNVDLLAIENFIVYQEQVAREAETLYSDEYLLRWEQLLFASKLLKKGRDKAALQIIEKWDLPITLRQNGFESGGRVIWLIDQREEVLRTWWDELYRSG
jgi:carbamoyltransferase